MAITPPLAGSTAHEFEATVQTFQTASGVTGKFYSLPALAAQFPSVKRLPVSLRIGDAQL